MNTSSVPRLSRILLLALTPLALFLAWQPARAAGEVTDCTEAGLTAAMNSGSGLITFNCGGTHAPATITVTHTYGLEVPWYTQYAINGGNVITLTGADANRLFIILSYAALTLTNIVLTNGYGNSAAVDVGTNSSLVLDHAMIQNSHTSGVEGGAIFAGAITSVTLQNNSVIQGNYGYSHGAIYSTGIVIVKDSIIRDNIAAIGGGAMSVGGTVTISNSQITGNRALNGNGGGLLIANLGNVTIDHSIIASNVATGTTARGGGVDNQGIVRLINSTLGGNAADIGGGINNAGSATLNNSTLSDNTAGRFGGGIENGGTATLNNSTISGNTAGYDGGGVENSFGTLNLINSTLSGNSAKQYWGGGICNFGKAVLYNSTVNNNTAAQGGGLFTGGSSATVLTNTILAGSSSGGNCYITVSSVTSFKYSLSSDLTCGSPVAGQLVVADPLLTALGNYGGPTLVHMLPLNSPAFNGVSGSDASFTDQRGYPRPQLGGYDVGAVERQPNDSDLAPRLFLPLLRR